MASRPTAGTTYGSEILLREALGLSTLHDQLAHVQRHMFVLQLLELAIQFGSVLGDDVLFVGAGRVCERAARRLRYEGIAILFVALPCSLKVNGTWRQVQCQLLNGITQDE